MANKTINSVPAVNKVSGDNKIPISQADGQAKTAKLNTIKDWINLNTVINYSDIIGKPTFSKVATSGSYTDLSGKPSIPAATSQLKNDSGFVSEIKENIINDKSFILEKFEPNNIYINTAVDISTFALPKSNPTYQPSYIVCKCDYLLPSSVELPKDAILLNVTDKAHLFKENSYVFMICIKNFILVFYGNEAII